MSKRKPAGYWTLERCMEDAAQYSSRVEWRKAVGGAYGAAHREGWLGQCCAHMELLVEHGKWTLELCKSKAAKHATVKEWRNSCKLSYSAAVRHGWVKQCSGHMHRAEPVNKFWTLDRCVEDAAEYSHKLQWRRASGGAYRAAHVNGWLDQCCGHMDSALCSTDNDVVYIWRDAGSDLHKVGVTSARVGEQRIGICRRHNGMDPRIVFMLKVKDARAVESKLLELGTDPELDSSVDGYTEFRKLTDAELGKAVSIAYEAALAA